MLLKQWLHVTQTSRHILTCKSPNPYRVINTLSEVMVFYSTFSHTIQLSKARESCSINHQSQIGFFKGMSSPSPPHPVTNSNITKTATYTHTSDNTPPTHTSCRQKPTGCCTVFCDHQKYVTSNSTYTQTDWSDPFVTLSAVEVIQRDRCYCHCGIINHVAEHHTPFEKANDIIKYVFCSKDKPPLSLPYWSSFPSSFFPSSLPLCSLDLPLFLSVSELSYITFVEERRKGRGCTEPPDPSVHMKAAPSSGLHYWHTDI